MYSRLSKLLKEKNSSSTILENQSGISNAAVLVLLHQHQNTDHILLTKRTETVAQHKGQICFPGGVRDKSDTDLWMTATRETQEELGIAPETISYIGALDPMITPTGFRVYPFIGALKSELIVHPSPYEIAEVFSVPLSHLLDSKNMKLVKRYYTDEDPTFIYQHYEIWGVTGRILMQLTEMLKSLVAPC